MTWRIGSNLKQLRVNNRLNFAAPLAEAGPPAPWNRAAHAWPFPGGRLVSAGKWMSLVSSFSLALASLTFSDVAFAEAILRTAACSTLSQVTYAGRDYSIRNYAVRHNLEWKNPNEEFDLQLHEQLSATFPPFATVVRDLVREAKGEDGRELSGSESAQVLGLYGTNPGPVAPPPRDYAYEWNSKDEGVRTDEVGGKAVGRYRVTKRQISDEVELIRQLLVEPREIGGIITRSEETSCFRFKQPRWMWSQLVPAPLETAAAAFDPIMYAADNAWNQLKECQAAKGSCDSLENIYLRAVEARDKVWKDDSRIRQLRDIGRKPDARGFAFTRFPEDVQVDEQGWLVLDQGSGYLDRLGEKTNGEGLRPAAEAIQNILEQQQLLEQNAATQARAEPSRAKPQAAQPVASEATVLESRAASTEVSPSQVMPADAQRATPKRPPAARSEAKIAKHGLRSRQAVARVQPRTRPLPRLARAPEDGFGWLTPLRPRPPLEPPYGYEVRMRREVSPFYFLSRFLTRL